jgi:hypothetical protein
MISGLINKMPGTDGIKKCLCGSDTWRIDKIVRLIGDELFVGFHAYTSVHVI